MKIILTIALGLVILQAGASAQMMQRTPTPNDTLQSVRVLPNGNTVFSIYAPKARTVSMTGDIMAMGAKTTERNGVWSIEVPGVKPGAYRYSFVVDGIQVFDPKFKQIKEIQPVAKIDPEQNMFWDRKDVPHGAMSQIFYKSSTTGTTRRAHVWTPAGYNASKSKLPVFYLIHGGGDNDASWPGVGCAGDILDNLLAEGKMVPMVVVMPDGSIDVQTFVKDFANDLKPYIEKNYRVKTGSANTALAGLSQGGLEVTETIQAHPDFFAYVNVMSSGWFVTNTQMYEEGEKSLGAAAETLKKNLKLLRFTVGGEEDGAYPNCHGMMKVYDKFGIKYEYSDMPGGHTWYVWRHDLYNFAQKLFK